MKTPPFVEKIKNEWEFASLALIVALLLLNAVMWTLALMRDTSHVQRLPTRGSPPIPESRVSYETAYRMLEPAEKIDIPADVAFGPNVDFRRPHRHRTKPEPEPIPKPDRKPIWIPKPKPEPKPEPEPIPEPEPVPEPKIEVQYFVYRGYRIGKNGVKFAHLYNETTDESYYLRERSKFRGLMVQDFSSSKITLVTARGKKFVLGPDDKLPYKAPPANGG